MAKPSKSKLKPLSSMRDKKRGTLDHISIHPARNADGSQGYITRVHRNRSEEDEKAMRKPGAGYIPSPEPEETIHEDGVDMVDHVKRHLGIKDEEPEEGDEDQED